MNYVNKLESKTINIGSGNNINIKEIANLISNNQLHIDTRPGEAENTLADITIAKKLLNFNPKTNVKDWIKSKI
jgi:nucleoside-diphosphate-sugar epimerase